MTASSFASALYIVIVVGSAVLAGAAMSAWRSSDVLDRALVGLIASACALVGAALALGMVGLLAWFPYALVMLAIGGASGVALARRTKLPRRAPAAWSPAGAAALFGGIFLTGLSLAPSLHGVRTGDGESRRYHITNLVSWVHSHNIWRLPFQGPGLFTATHPGNGEIVAVGLLFATGRDQLVYTTFALFGAICVIAAASIVRDLGGAPDRGALTMLAFLATPLVYATQGHALMTDLAAAAPMLAGVACVFRARRENDTRWIALAGCALGLGLGAKYTVLWLVPVVVVGAFLVLRPWKRAAWLAPGLAFFAGPWFVRNLVRTRNPIFPQGFAVGGHQVLRAGSSPYLALNTTIASHALSRHWTVLERWAHLVWHFGGPASLLVAAAIVCVVIERPRRRDRLELAVLALLGIAIYAVTPFTGAGPNGLAFLIGSSLRYLIPAAVVAVSLAPVVVPSRILAVIVGAMFVFDGLSFVKGFGFRTDLALPGVDVLAAAALAAVACLCVMRSGRRDIPLQRLAYAGVPLALVVVAASLVSIDHHRTITELEKLVESARADRVAVLGASDYRSILGPDLSAHLEDVVPGGSTGDAPAQSAAALAKDVDSSSADTLVVSDGTPGVPSGWKPSTEWTKVGDTPGGDVYVRKPAVTPPAAPAPPQPSAAPRAPVP